MSQEIKSTFKEPRYTATCKHCDSIFAGFSLDDLIDHVLSHEIGIFFENISVKTTIVEPIEEVPAN